MSLERRRPVQNLKFLSAKKLSTEPNMQRVKVTARCDNGLWLGTLETLNFFLVEAVVGRLPPAVATIENRSTGLLRMVGMGQ